MLEQLRIVLEAEAEARQRLETARAAAKQLVADAEEEAGRRVQQARVAREQVAQTVEAEWVEQARQRAAATAAEVRVRIQALEARATPRMERTAQVLVHRVLGVEQGDGH
jgi:vacuolar-type H+-ATPase subunit H